MEAKAGLGLGVGGTRGCPGACGPGMWAAWGQVGSFGEKQKVPVGELVPPFSPHSVRMQAGAG